MRGQILYCHIVIIQDLALAAVTGKPGVWEVGENHGWNNIFKVGCGLANSFI